MVNQIKPLVTDPEASKCGSCTYQFVIAEGSIVERTTIWKPAWTLKASHSRHGRSSTFSVRNRLQQGRALRKGSLYMGGMKDGSLLSPASENYLHSLRQLRNWFPPNRMCPTTPSSDILCRQLWHWTFHLHHGLLLRGLLLHQGPELPTLRVRRLELVS
jgi:hypothetical protein